MPGTLTHSPADVLRRALIDLGLGSAPPATPWPVYASSEPSSPENVITVYDTEGRDEGREMILGERQERHGFQIRVRAGTHTEGYTKARAIAVALDEVVYMRAVSIEGIAYLIWAISRTSDVISLGTNVTSSKRQVFTINGTVSLRQR